MTTTALILASVALALALVACTALIVVGKQSAQALTDVRRHRLAHSAAHGAPDPGGDRRRRNTGPPPGQPDRRQPRPSDQRAAPPTTLEPALRVDRPPVPPRPRPRQEPRP